MLARLSLRFVLVLLLTGAATIALVTMFEAMIRATLSFGIAASVVLPLMVGARSAGGVLVVQTKRAANVQQIVGYGLWCAGLGLIMLAGFIWALQMFTMPEPIEAFLLLTRRPATSLGLLALAYATCALITITGFALGARAQTRLLPQRQA